jgi:hypothetical protein
VGTQHRDVIEINGKKYDAVTGRMIKEDEDTKSSPSKVTPIVNKNGVLDGFTRRTAQTAHPDRHPVQHAKHAQKSQTLMRSAVKKPQPQSSKPTTTSHKPAQQITKQSAHITPQKQHSAQATPKNPLVSKYGHHQAQSPVVKKVQHMPVKHPVAQTAQHPTQKQATTAVARPKTYKSDAAVHRALAQAKAHHEESVHVPHHPRKRKLAHRLGITPRAISISTSVLAVTLLAGFFAIQNIPNLSMRVAATRAGISASMPGYTPTGFGFSGPIQYNKGQVTITFASNTDDRSYAIRQRESSWNSEALLSNFVVAENKQYQTYIDRGRTLYIYDGSNATWVDDGIWYQVEGDSRMTTDQLVRIAASI